MKIVIDIECNGLRPTKVWVIVCKDLVTGRLDVFRRPSDDTSEKDRFISFINDATTLVGHNLLGYDYPAIRDLLGVEIPDIAAKSIDTFICAKLIDYQRPKHSVESYGEEFGLSKIDFSDWSQYSLEMEEYCIRDVDITERIYKKYRKYIDNPDHRDSLTLENSFQLVVNAMEDNGFAINTVKVDKLLDKVTKGIAILDKDIKETFVPRLKPIREVLPRGTKYGTISLSSVPVSLRSDMSVFTVDAPFTHCHWVEFNPDSPKQRLEVLNKAGWRPEEKTKAHVDTEREHNRLSRIKKRPPEFDLVLKDLYNKLLKMQEYGWKVNETNLSTLPPDAPPSARLLSKRIIYESRRKTLQEWKDLERDGRIHGSFQAIGTWTGRMAHQKPNMANIANEFEKNGKDVKFLGKELRQCWIAPKNRLLAGVDAESIQLRIFAHLINDPILIKSLVDGKKEDKTDAHNLTKSILGDLCSSRQAAKTFLYAYFLGAGLGKVQSILGCGRDGAEEAARRLVNHYPGLKLLREEIIPADARRGWFYGVDGRKVPIRGDTVSERQHLALSGYLQNGEAVIIRAAAVDFSPKLLDFNSFLVDIVHDEFQIETPNDFSIALQVCKIVDQAIRDSGTKYKLNCPMAGSYYNDDHKEYTIGNNWYETH